MLTRQQIRLLAFIYDQLLTTGIAPSFDEMKDYMGLKSKSGIHRLVTALEERGFIKRSRILARSMEVLRLPPVLHSQDYIETRDRIKILAPDLFSFVRKISVMEGDHPMISEAKRLVSGIG